MPFSRSGNHYRMRIKRQCKSCNQETWQMCVSVRYSQPTEPTVPASLRKRLEWICETCGNMEEEVKQVYEPTDKVRIINRLLRIPEDYDFIKMRIESLPDEIVLRIKVPDFDPSEMRAIQHKQQETGFINVDELIRLQKAGFRRPMDVPPKPTPKGNRLRERATQRMFIGEPKSI